MPIQLLRPVAIFALAGLFPILAWMVPAAPGQQPAPAAGRGPAGADDDRPAEPEELELVTDDGLIMKATYYPGPPSEQTAPILLLHDFKSNRNVFRPLALALQEREYSVLAADLRGHGGSTQFRHPITGQVRELRAADMERADFEAMVQFDVETLRRFLRDKNNQRELNLNSLCIVGAEMGALVGSLWAARDWSAPPLPGGKQGQDVKALVLVSPPWTYESIPIRPGLDHQLLRSSVAILVLVGERETNALRDARRVYNEVERFHPEPEDAKDDDLYLLTRDTSLQGTALLNAAELNTTPPILEFIQRRIGDPSFPWSERVSLTP